MELMHSGQYGKVAVLMGGDSSEREVSLLGGNAVLTALLNQGVDAHSFDPKYKPIWALRNEGFERVFIMLHGPFGEDGTLQGALEAMRLPYTGSGVMASSIAMDKWRTKLIWQAAGIPTPEYVVVDAQTDFAAVEARLGLPIFIKSASEGSSIALFKAKVPGDLRKAYEELVKTDHLIIAERAIEGGEYTVGILGEMALPMIRIEPDGEFYDYHAKYISNDTQYFCPCGLPSAQEEDLKALALRAFHLLGGQGWGRVDVMLDQAGKPYFLEVNTVPGMTDHSLVPKAAKAIDISFGSLVLQILDGAHVG